MSGLQSGGSRFKGPAPSEKFPIVRKEGAMPASGKGSSFLGQLETMAMQDPAGLDSFLSTYQGGNGQIATRSLEQNMRDAGSAISGNSGFNVRRSGLGTSVATSGGTSGLSGYAPQDPYAQEDSRFKDRAKFEQSLASQGLRDESDIALDRQSKEMELKMALLNKLLGLTGGMNKSGRTTTSTSDTSGMEYVNIAGRPVSMPTSSKTRNTQKESGMSADALLQLLLGAL